MIDPHFVLVGAVLSVIGCSFYVRAVVAGTARPNRVSWLLWATMPVIAFLAQLDEGVGLSAVLTLSVALGPAVVFGVSFVNRASYWKINRLDLACGLISVVAIVAWLGMNSPVLAVVMVVLADSVAALPTLVKSWRFPHTERVDYYVLAALNGMVTVATLDSWRLVDWLFPVYVVTVAATLATTIALRRGQASFELDALTDIGVVDEYDR